MARHTGGLALFSHYCLFAPRDIFIKHSYNTLNSSLRSMLHTAWIATAFPRRSSNGTAGLPSKRKPQPRSLAAFAILCTKPLSVRSRWSIEQEAKETKGKSTLTPRSHVAILLGADKV